MPMDADYIKNGLKYGWGCFVQYRLIFNYLILTTLWFMRKQFWLSVGLLIDIQWKLLKQN